MAINKSFGIIKFAFKINIVYDNEKESQQNKSSSC